jgi:hypothetical protein
VIGRVDPTLGHGGFKASLEDIPVFVEAKSDGDCSSAIPQTLLVYIMHANELGRQMQPFVVTARADK